MYGAGVHVTCGDHNIIFCADVEEMNDALHCLLTADSNSHGARGDSPNHSSNSVKLSANESVSYTHLTLPTNREV